MSKITAYILTFNEESNIERCIRSLTGVIDEILVVDSVSKDGTREICQRFPELRFIEQAFLGYSQQRNFAIGLASHEWILTIDADEALSTELRNSILTLKQEGMPMDGYSMNRLNWYCGDFIRHGTWYPDRSVRLFRRSKGRYTGSHVHEKMDLDPDAKTQWIKGDLLHYSFPSINFQVQKNLKYSSLMARQNQEKGKKATLFKLVFNPFFAFFNHYLIRLGFLDGIRGYYIAKQSAFYTFLKYAKMRQLEENGSEEYQP
jgi:glycosyltransferase involved in cell wall biosynthesis